MGVDFAGIYYHVMADLSTRCSDELSTLIMVTKRQEAVFDCLKFKSRPFPGRASPLSAPVFGLAWCYSYGG